MLLAEFYNQILTEADLPPGELKKLHSDIAKIRSDTGTQSAEHNAFFKKLTKEIINNNVEGYRNTITRGPTPLIPYNVRKSWVDQPEKAQDFEYVKRKAPEQAEAIMAVPDDSSLNPEFKPGTVKVHMVYMDAVDGEIAMWVSRVFGGEEAELEDEDAIGMPRQHPFKKFWGLVHDEKFMNNADPGIAKKLTAIKQKYINGTYNLYNLEKTTKKLMDDLGQQWKHDKEERARLETEAPVIMKFKNGMMWVRLDSKAEMEREGEMMQNCISGYCPVDQEEALDSTFGLRAEFAAEYEPSEQTDDAVYEFLENWVEENGSIQDYIEDKLDRVDPWEDEIGATQVEDMSDEEALDWMATQIIEADADIETGAPPGGHLVYSLRDKHGESHISAEYDPQMDMNYPEPTEALGKQNKQALDKYKPYIEKLNDFFGEYPETFGPRGNTQDMPFHPDYDDDKEH